MQPADKSGPHGANTLTYTIAAAQTPAMPETRHVRTRRDRVQPHNNVSKVHAAIRNTVGFKAKLSRYSADSNLYSRVMFVANSGDQ